MLRRPSQLLSSRPSRVAAALAAAIFCGLTLTTSPTLAVRISDRPVYLITSVDVHKSEEWRAQDPGYPDRCTSWEFAEGSANLGMSQRGTRRLTLMSLDRFGVLGEFDGEMYAPSELRRSLRFRYHSRPDTPECSPCGPLSEYGACSVENLPDTVHQPKCSPPHGRGPVNLFLDSRGLQIVAAPMLEKALAACPEQSVLAPEGMMRWQLEPVTFRGAVRTLLRMKVRGEHTFRRETETERGRGCRRIAGEGYRSCVTYTTVVVVQRIR